MKRGSQIQIPKRSVGESVRSDIITVVMSCALFYLISSIFKAIFSPLKYLTMSREQIDEEEIQKAQQKIARRNYRLTEFRDNPNDPLNVYASNPGDVDYAEWFRQYKAGNIEDPDLRWAPDVYRDKKISGEFLNYIERQTEILSGMNRSRFLVTVRKYYPELTPSFNGIRNDVASLRERIRERDLRDQLGNEIRKLGVPERIARKMSASDMGIEQMTDRARAIKDCIERGYCEGASECIVDNHIDAGSEDARIVNEIMSNYLPASLALAYIRDEINTGQLKEISDIAAALISNFGMMYAFDRAESGKTVLVELVEYEIDKRRKENRKKSVKAVWES